MKLRMVGVMLLALSSVVKIQSVSQPVRASKYMVVAQDRIGAQVGADVLREGGNAIDATVATGFALAVTHPTAGNIGGGGFMVYRPATGEPLIYEFRETAPARSSPTMFLVDGKLDTQRYREGLHSTGVPGTVAGLYMAWKERGKLPWNRLVEPAVKLARDGFVVSHEFSRSLTDVLPSMQKYPASVAQFSKNGVPYQPGEIFTQPDLAKTLTRVMEQGPPGFYEGETAMLIEKEMLANGGLITREDLKAYRPKKRVPVRGTYRGYEIISMPPISAGGTALIQMLNMLEGYDLAASGPGSATTIHLMVESMRRAWADRARYLGDPDFNPQMPIDRLISKDYAAMLRKTISRSHASKSSPASFEWPVQGTETTHFSIVDEQRNAVSLTYTLQAGYGNRIVVPGAGFLLNNDMFNFNAGPGLTDETGNIGTEPNLAMAGKRPLSNMTPTILAKDGKLFMVTGSPGGRTIINTVLQTIINVVDFGMNVHEAVSAPRIHHQWLPDRLGYERYGLSPDTVRVLEGMGHKLQMGAAQGSANAIIYNAKQEVLEGGSDPRSADSAAIGR